MTESDEPGEDPASALLRWTPGAVEDLALELQRLTRFDPKTALKVLVQIESLVEQLVDFPFSGRAIPEIGDESVREVVCRNYRVAYRVTEESVDILTVFSTRKRFVTGSLVGE